jgi:hypothetical protein
MAGTTHSRSSRNGLSRPMLRDRIATTTATITSVIAVLIH